MYSDHCTSPLCFLSIIASDISYLAASPSIVLVEDFSLLAGSQDVKVPENVTSGTYTVIRESAREISIII